MGGDGLLWLSDQVRSVFQGSAEMRRFIWRKGFQDRRNGRCGELGLEGPAVCRRVKDGQCDSRRGESCDKT